MEQNNTSTTVIIMKLPNRCAHETNEINSVHQHPDANAVKWLLKMHIKLHSYTYSYTFGVIQIWSMSSLYIRNLINHGDSSTPPTYWMHPFQYRYTISFMYDMIIDTTLYTPYSKRKLNKISYNARQISILRIRHFTCNQNFYFRLTNTDDLTAYKYPP